MRLSKSFITFAALLSMTLLWASAQDPKRPDARVSAHLIYSRGLNALLLLDGYQIHLDSTRADTWAWNGTDWKQSVQYGPGSRSLTACALNTSSGKIHCFGGIGNRGYESKRGDVWIFDGENWNTVSTNDVGTRDHHEMVYADHLGAFVVYGGLPDTRVYDTTTWILKENGFTRLDIPGPGIRYHFSMAYDPERNKVVLYGGGPESRQGETWEYDGEKWKQIQADINPGKRFRHSMVYDGSRKAVVLHGGGSDTNTWAWNGQSWKLIAISGPQGDLQALGWDPKRKTIVAYGGSLPDNIITAQLWELDPGGKWSKLSENGQWKWVEKRFQKVMSVGSN